MSATETTTEPLDPAEQDQRLLSGREQVNSAERLPAAVGWLGGLVFNFLAPLVVWLVVRGRPGTGHAVAHARRATVVYVAVSAATRMSQVSEASRPPPKANPLTAATTGLRSSRSASQ